MDVRAYSGNLDNIGRKSVVATAKLKMKQRLAEEAHERGKAEIERKWTGVVVQMKVLIKK